MSVRQPTTVHGVDFGVGARDAGRSTWITTIETGATTDDAHTGETPRVTACGPATERLDCAPDRPATMAALRSWLAGLGRTAAVGLDFPFGVPARLLDSGIDEWREMLAWFDQRCETGAFDGPDAFSSWGVERAREVTDGERAYLPRATDRATSAQCVYGFIGKYPAFYGLRDLLVPLVIGASEPAVTVLPVMADEGDRPLLLETYPAAIHERRGVYRESYKEATTDARQRRIENREALTADIDCRLPEEPADRIADDTDGDALDSLAAAVAAVAATRTARSTPADAEQRLEAKIYT